MKLRGGQWGADTSDAKALAAALYVSAMAPLKIEEQTTTLFSNAGNDEQRLTQGEIGKLARTPTHQINPTQDCAQSDFRTTPASPNCAHDPTPQPTC